MNCDQFQKNATPERYLRGQLSESERDEFELHYFSCDLCYTELEALRLAGAELKQRPPERFQPAREKSASWWSWWWAAPVAAAAAYAVFVVAGPSLRAPEQQRQQREITQAPPASPASDLQLLALAKFDPPPYAEAHMRGAVTPEPAGSRFLTAMRPYQAGDYRQASALLEPLLALDKSKSPPQVLFYAAGCRLLNGDAAGAEQGATQLIAMGETSYLEEAYWMRAKARFALRKLDAGRDDLRKLASLKGDWETKANQLLDRSLEIR